MKIVSTTVCVLLLFLSGDLCAQNDYEVYINEIRANDESTDDIEFIELIGPAGTDLTGFQIIHYNGTESQDGGLWTHTIGSFTIPDDGIIDNRGKALGFYVLGCSGNAVDPCDEVIAEVLQNGEDGIILYDAEGTILDAVAWQGAGDMPTDDPGTVTTSPPASANNFLHVTLDDDAGDRSLQAPNDVHGDDGSGWVIDSATVGAINRSQLTGDIQLPVQLTFFSAAPGNNHIILTWRTESETNNQGFILTRSQDGQAEFHEIASYRTCDALRGSQSTSQRKNYRYTDHYVFNNITYRYKLIDVDYSGMQTERALVSATPINMVDKIINTTSENIPNTFHLAQNVPNPFNPSTIIRLDLPQDILIRLDIYTITGQKIKSLIRKSLPAGSHFVHWDGTNDKGIKVPSGLYFYQLACEKYYAVKKMILTR